MISDATIEFLRDHAQHHADKPLLTYVWFSDVHTPMKPTKAMRALYADKPEPSQTHYAMLTFLDEQIGRILATLDELGMAKNTLVLFCSDNGAVLSRGGSNGVLRGEKWTLYEGGIRSPLIVRWPEQTPPGRVDETSLLNICDLTPTFCHLAGANMPQGYESDGVDATEALRGTSISRSKPMLWHHPTGGDRGPTLAVRDGDWKLLMDPGGLRPVLHNLASDVSEKHDVAAENGAVVKRLKDTLQNWAQSLPKQR